MIGGTAEVCLSQLTQQKKKIMMIEIKMIIYTGYCNTIIKFEFMTTFFHKSSSHGYVGVRKYFVKHPKSYTYVTRHMYKLKENGSGINAMGWLFETFKTRSLFLGIFLRKKRPWRRVYAAVVCDGT